MPEQLLTPAQVATQLQVKERSILDWLRSGDLPDVKAGRLWRVRPGELARFLDARSTPRRNA